MDPSDVDTARQLLLDAGSGFIADTAFRHLAFSAFALLVVAGVLTYIVKRGEKSLGLDVKKAIDNLEKAAGIYVDTQGRFGTIWPIPLVFCVIIVCSAWVAVTINRP